MIRTGLGVGAPTGIVVVTFRKRVVVLVTTIVLMPKVGVRVPGRQFWTPLPEGKNPFPPITGNTPDGSGIRLPTGREVFFPGNNPEGSTFTPVLGGGRFPGILELPAVPEALYPGGEPEGSETTPVPGTGTPDVGWRPIVVGTVLLGEDWTWLDELAPVAEKELIIDEWIGRPEGCNDLWLDADEITLSEGVNERLNDDDEDDDKDAAADVLDESGVGDRETDVMFRMYWKSRRIRTGSSSSVCFLPVFCR